MAQGSVHIGISGTPRTRRPPLLPSHPHRRSPRGACVFFDNARKVRASHDAMRLADRMHLDWKERHAND